MKYSKTLIYALRNRNYSDREIADIIAEVESNTETGINPEEFYGSPETYAKLFPEKRGIRANWILLLGLFATSIWLFIGLTQLTPGKGSGANALLLLSAIILMLAFAALRSFLLYITPLRK